MSDLIGWVRERTYMSVNDSEPRRVRVYRVVVMGGERRRHKDGQLLWCPRRRLFFSSRGARRVAKRLRQAGLVVEVWRSELIEWETVIEEHRDEEPPKPPPSFDPPF